MGFEGSSSVERRLVLASIGHKAEEHRGGLGPLQADHLAESVDQEHEQHQDGEDVFDAIAAPLVELLIEIQMHSVLQTRRVPPFGDVGSMLYSRAARSHFLWASRSFLGL